MSETPARCSLRSGDRSEAQVAAFVGATVALTGGVLPRDRTAAYRNYDVQTASIRYVRSRRFETSLKRLKCANSGHVWTAPRGQGSL